MRQQIFQHNNDGEMCVRVYACVRACARARVCVCVCVCVCDEQVISAWLHSSVALDA